MGNGGDSAEAGLVEAEEAEGGTGGEERDEDGLEGREVGGIAGWWW